MKYHPFSRVDLYFMKNITLKMIISGIFSKLNILTLAAYKRA